MFQLQLFFAPYDEWDRVVALPRHTFVTGATLLQLGGTTAIECQFLSVFHLQLICSFFYLIFNFLFIYKETIYTDLPWDQFLFS